LTRNSPLFELFSRFLFELPTISRAYNEVFYRIFAILGMNLKKHSICYAKICSGHWAIGWKARNVAMIDYLNLFSLNTVGPNQRFSNQ
jgi:hypothetical protein